MAKQGSGRAKCPPIKSYPMGKKTPQVGSLSYFCDTRHGITYEVARLAQGLAAPTKGHQLALRRVMAYLSTVPDEKLWVKRVMGDTSLANIL